MSAPLRPTGRSTPLAPRSDGRALVIGHRGAPGYRPEHTRSSLLLAVEQGADALEVDVVPSRDGVLVVRHDRDLATTTDVGRRRALRDLGRTGARGRRAWYADDLDWSDIAGLRSRERMPRTRPDSALHDGEEGVLRLEEVLELAAGAGVPLVVEIKDSLALAARGLDPVPLLRAVLAAAPRLPALVIESFEKSALLALADLPHPLVYLLEPVGTAPDEVREGQLARSYRQELADPRALAGFAGVSLHAGVLTAERVGRLHELGLAVWTWTLRPENRFLPRGFRSPGGGGALGDWPGRWAEVLATGVDAVFTDQPDLALRVVDALPAAPVSPGRSRRPARAAR